MLTMLVFAIHIGAGVTSLVSGLVAVFAPKGGRIHRVAGTTFLVAMLVTAAFAGYLAVVMPGQVVNLFIAIFTAYLVVTAWLTARRQAAGLAQGIMLVVGLVISAPFVLLSFQLAAGIPPFLQSAAPFRGPILVAIYSFTVVLLIAVVGDLRVVLAGGATGVARIARHLWRMCLALTLATGSAFTNGLPRLLPDSVDIPLALLFIPHFGVLFLLAFWMIRVRLPGWRLREASTHLN